MVTQAVKSVSGVGAEGFTANFEDFEEGFTTSHDGLQRVARIAARVGFAGYGIAVVGAAGEADPMTAGYEPLGDALGKGSTTCLVEGGPDAAVEGQIERFVRRLLQKVGATKLKGGIGDGVEAAGGVDGGLGDINAEDAIAEGSHLGGLAAEAAADVDNASAGWGEAGEEIGQGSPGLAVVPGSLTFLIPGFPVLAGAAGGPLFGVGGHSAREPRVDCR